MELFHSVINFILLSFKHPMELIQAVGYIGLTLMVFSEAGLLVGFFLPGDSLLIAAGVFAATRTMNIVVLLALLTVAAITGNTLGYCIGKKLGVLLYKKEDSFFFRKKHINTAHEFYEKHGGKVIIIACFIPIIRAFVPAVAGAANMNYVRFISFNIIGSVLWVWGMLLSGYYLGLAFGDSIGSYIHIIILVVILISFLPFLIKWHKKSL